LFAPEVVQTSAMDCGPASLKCILAGHGVDVSYDRLREACQTDVDGTSIDTLEEIAKDLGLDAEQVMLPVDHLLLDEARALPALVVVRLPNGFTHFVVLWKRHGPLVQVMDPGSGRRWISCARFLADLFVHETTVPLEDFSEWIAGDDFRRPLDRRMQGLGLDAATRTRRLRDAHAGGWRAGTALDAAVRFVASLKEKGALRGSAEIERMLGTATENPETIPPDYFTGMVDENAPADEPRVRLRGAVLVTIRGVATQGRGSISPELVRALQEPPARPLRTLARLVREGGWLAPGMLLVALALAARGALAEALLFRAALELPRHLATVVERLGAAAALVVFVAAARTLDTPVVSGTLRLGRQLDVRLRRAFLSKLPLLGDRYFQSRPLSDMADRAHGIHAIRELPQNGARFMRAVAEMVATSLAIAWLDPPSFPFALAAGALALALPLAWQPALAERDMRVRSHGGALARWSLDALLALIPIRTHGAERALSREHESLVGEWARASRALVRGAAWSEAVQSLATVIPVAWMIVRYVSRAPDTSGVLLLAYWGLAVPSAAEEIASVLRQVPGQRNVTLRLLEPLGLFDERAPESGSARATKASGVAIEMRGVGVVAAGHTILQEVDLAVAPGEHIGIVGPSGAGKSSLVALLLGWHRAATGSVTADGVTLEGACLDELRHHTAWIDPAVQVWNQSLLANLQYGAEESADALLSRILEGAQIEPLLDRLPDGLQTALGEGGALVSGGEGQRVRLGRAMMRPSARLVILDEAFRGLDRDRRRVLLARARVWWKDATLICITHDVSETLSFDRVCVVEGGRIVEDGSPRRLSEDPSSRYGAMLRSERAVLETMWGSGTWRRWRLEGGLIAENQGVANGKEVA
jgi:ATP-binding cassette subfamily B protein